MTDSPTARLRACLDVGHADAIDPADLRAVLADLDAGKAREAVLAGALRETWTRIFAGREAVSVIDAALSNVGAAAEALLERLAAAERERGRLARELEECTNERDAARVVSEGRVRAERERDAALAERDRLRARVAELEAK